MKNTEISAQALSAGLSEAQKYAERMYETFRISEELMEFLHTQVQGAFLSFSEAMRGTD